jgi:hypothetical protein
VSSRSRTGRAAILLAAALVASPLAAAEAPRVSVELSPDPVGLDELATLTVRIDSQGFGLADVDEPQFDLENLQVASGPFRSQNQSWVNGTTSSATEIVWNLQPTAEGAARVKNLRVHVAGVERRLADAVIQVARRAPPATARPPASRRQALPEAIQRLLDQDPFDLLRSPREEARPLRTPKIVVHADATPVQAWVGQQIDWRLYCDTQTDVSEFRPRDLPEFPGFWALEVRPPNAGEPEWVNLGGERFGRVLTLERLIYPLRTGSFDLPALRINVVARVAEAGFFGRVGRDQPMVLKTRPIHLEVRSLPAGAPAGFSGLVGPVSIDAALDHDRIDGSGAANLTLRASGTGHLQGIDPPQLDLPPGLRVFPPAVSSDTRLDHGDWTTEVRWTYVVTADHPGGYDIAPISLAYFDPASESYRAATTRPLHLAVTPAANVVASAAPAIQATRAGASSPAAATPTFGWRGLPTPRPAWVLGIGLVLAAGVAVVSISRRQRHSPSPHRRLVEALEEARRGESARAAARSMESAWRAFLSERYGLGRALPLAQWPEWLGGRGVDGARTTELVAIFEELQLLEFAPELSDQEGLRRELENRSTRLARKLR